MYDQNYITAYGTQTKVTAVALPAGTPMQLVAQNFNRHLLTLQVTGTAPATFGFGAAPPAAGQGLALDGASTAGGQGGAYEFKDIIPSDAIWAIAAAGTAVVVIEGF